MAATVIPMPKFMAFSDAGAPLSAGLVYTYAAGTTTPLATYSDSDLTTPNTNPVVLDSAGRATIYLTASSYKIVLKNSAGATVYTQDNIIAAAPYNVDLDVPITAGEVLTAGQAIYLSDGTGSRTAGRWYLTDSDTAAYSTVPITGFVTTALALGEEGSVRLLGQATVPGPVSVGLTYYLSGTPGAISTSAGTFVKNMGTADSTTTLIMTVATPVTPGGSNTQVQFNDSGVLGGDAGFTYIKATDAVAIGGPLAVTGATTLSSTVATGALTVTGAATVSTTLGVTGATTLSSTVATGALTVTGAATVSTTLGVTGAITSATSVALTGTTNNLGTITTGVWNAGAVTSSGPFSLTGSTSATFAVGGTSSILLDATSNYNVLSLINSTSLTSNVGLFGGASGDATSLYFIAATGGAFQWRSGATGDFMSLSSAGLLTVSGFGTHSFSAGGTGGNVLSVRNTTSGTGNYSMLILGNDASASLLQLAAFSSAYTPSGTDYASGVRLNASGAGGLSIQAEHASGAIRFYTGGATQRWAIGTDGTLTGASNIIEIGASTYRATGATGTAYMGYVTSQAQFEILFNSTSVGVRLTSGANAWAALSDARLKTTLTPFTDAAATLRGVRTGTGRYLIDDSSISRSFMIAQDFETGLPEAITRDETDGMLMLRYTDTIPLIISGWQQHDATISQLAARIAALEGRQ